MEKLELRAKLFTTATLHLQDMGYISVDGRKLSSIFTMPYLMIGLFMKLGIIGEIYKEFYNLTTTEFFNNLVFLISLSFQTSVAVSFYVCRTDFPTFIDRISTYKYGVSQNYLRLVKRMEKITGAIYNYIVYGYTIFAFMNQKTYQECADTKKGQDTDLYYCGIYSTSWYPISMDFIPVKQMVLVLEILELVYFIPKLSTTIVFLYGSIELTENRIDDLKCFLRNTVVTEKNFEEVNWRLKYAVKKFVEITETVDGMNSTIGFVFSPLQQFIILGLLIFLEFRVLLERNMESIPLLFFWSSFELLVCWKGQRLENASASLARDVYEFPWYDLHPSSRNLYKLFYGQVQPILQFKSKPFICFNMRYYHEIIKGSYSVLMYIRRF